jgi:hypothetical protein
LEYYSPRVFENYVALGKKKREIVNTPVNVHFVPLLMQSNFSEGKSNFSEGNLDPDYEPLLTENKNRFVLFPINHRAIWNMYKKAEASFWTTEEIDLAADVKDWTEKLNNDERYFISMVLAFFAASDGIVNENLATKFMGEVQVAEAR